MKPQQPKAAPTPTNTIDNSLDEILEFYKEGILLVHRDAPKTLEGQTVYFNREKALVIAAINKTIMEAIREATCRERKTFIADDKAGRNAVYIAKQKQLHLHTHDFNHTSHYCECGISRAEVQELDRLSEDEIAELRQQITKKYGRADNE